MKSSELKQLIKEAVGEQIKEMLPSLLAEHMNGVKRTNSSTPMTPIGKTVLREVSSKPIPNKPVVYTKNPVLNSILNETVCKIPTDGAGSMVSQGGPSVLDLKEESIPGNLSKIFNKNYTSLLKEVEKKVVRP